MSAKITVTNIPLQTTPGINQVFTVQHKLGSDPDIPGSWTIDNAAQVVTPAGVLSPPLVITGLLNGTLYNVRAINNCNPAYVANLSITTPLPSCVMPLSITATTAEE